MSGKELPALMDRKQVAALFGAAEVKDARASVDAVFRAVPEVRLPGLRKPFVRGEDVARLVEAGTFDWEDGRCG